jgi:hypothetical protein
MSSLKKHVLVKQVIDAKKVLKKSQKELLALVRDKSHDINERFDIWKELVDKEHHDYIYHFQQTSEKDRSGSKTYIPPCLIDWEDNLDQRYETHDWEQIYQSVIDNIETDVEDLDYTDYKDTSEWNEKIKEHYEAYTKACNESQELKDVKEWFIQENFGSFKFDW